MITKTPIFPNIEIIEALIHVRYIHEGCFKWTGKFFTKKRTVSEYAIQIITNIRVQGNDGRWYITKITKHGRAPEEQKEVFKNQFISFFIYEAYKAILLIKVPQNPDSILDVFESPVFKLDDNQESEIERMKRIF